MFAFVFPSFSLIGWVKNKFPRENIETMIPVTTTWQTQPWYTLLLGIFIQRSLFLPALQKLLINPLIEKHPLVRTRSLRLAAWATSGTPRKLKEFQVMQPNVSPCPGDQFLLQVTNQLEQMGLMVLPTANWSSLCTFKWNIEPFVNTVWKRPTISTYKFTPLCYFSLPRLCRWKACWETHFPCFTDRCLQSKSTTALLYIFLGC